MKILVAIPAYNCEKQIGRVLGEFEKQLLDKVSKVIVIDNGSKDATVEKAKQAAKKLGSNKLEVWQNKENYNLGGTHKVAFLAAEKLKMDYVAILHGDDQAETKELKNLISVVEKNEHLGAVLGSRFMKGSKLKNYSWERIVGNRVINIIFSAVSLRRCKDLGSGLNLFRVKDLSGHEYLGFGDTITFNIDLLLFYLKRKIPITFFPISWKEEDQVSNARNFNVGFTALKKLFRWRFGKEVRIQRRASDYKSEKI